VFKKFEGRTSGLFSAVNLSVALLSVFCVFIWTRDLFLSDMFFLRGIRLVAGICVGIFMVTVALEGYLFTKVNGPLRVLTFIGGLCLIDSRIATDVFGFVVLVQLLAYQKFLIQREEALRFLKKTSDTLEDPSSSG
jgi:TRAP-type uncharacterized transport system fused permease subunit